MPLGRIKVTMLIIKSFKKSEDVLCLETSSNSERGSFMPRNRQFPSIVQRNGRETAIVKRNGRETESHSRFSLKKLPCSLSHRFHSFVTTSWFVHLNLFALLSSHLRVPLDNFYVKNSTKIS